MVKAECLQPNGAIVCLGVTRLEAEKLASGRAFRAAIEAQGRITLVIIGAETNDAAEAEIRASLAELEPGKEVRWTRLEDGIRN